MRCPKDARDTPNDDMCRQQSLRGYGCTRKKGHKGKHHAHGIKFYECYDVW